MKNKDYLERENIKKKFTIIYNQNFNKKKILTTKKLN